MGKPLVNFVGIILVIFGLVGFFNDPLLGVFNVDPALNVFHLIVGILALTFGNVSEFSARNFALLFGIIFAILTLMSFATTRNEVVGMTLSNSIGWLYLLFTVLLLPTGLARHPRTTVRSA